jgi:hypothetical protein
MIAARDEGLHDVLDPDQHARQDILFHPSLGLGPDDGLVVMYKTTCRCFNCFKRMRWGEVFLPSLTRWCCLGPPK